MLIVLSGVVAFGWTFGVALVALAALTDAIPQGWATRELLAGRGRRSALLIGITLLLISTTLYIATELMLSVGSR